MRNVGPTDRLIRLIVGIVLVAIGLAPLVGSPWTLGVGPLWQWLALIVGAVLMVTASIRFCPAYTLFGWNTCRRDV